LNARRPHKKDIKTIESHTKNRKRKTKQKGYKDNQKPNKNTIFYLIFQVEEDM
tara:strand:- start:362 stop:520 length:159 start_codon:yes stop_codon:yes gene_type:complete